jgi:hypothetical protein
MGQAKDSCKDKHNYDRREEPSMVKDWIRSVKSVGALSASVCLLLAACRATHPAPAMTPITPEVSRKLDPGVRALVAAAQSKDLGALERTAKERNVALEHGAVRVQLTAGKAEDVPALEKLVTDSGGQVSTRLGAVMFVLLPPAQIRKIAADGRVWNITLPVATVFPLDQHPAR